MQKNIKYIIVIFVFMFVFSNVVNAECNYQERKNLLEKSKDIEVYFEPDLNNKYFVFNLYNLDDELYVNIYNSKTEENKEVHSYDMVDNHYSFIDNNIDDIITYRVTIYVSNSSCYGNKLTTKTITKKIINRYYYMDICNGIKDYQYCKPLLNNKFSLNDDKIKENINKYKESLNVKEDTKVINKFGIDDLIKILKEYWYIVLIVICVSIGFVAIIKINKKRGDLV